MAEDLGERTEAPTGKRLSDARMRGQIARSTDLSAALLLAAVIVVLLVLGDDLFGAMKHFMRHELERGMGAVSMDDRTLTLTALQSLVRAVITLGPIMALLLVAAYAVNFLQVGWLISTQTLAPKWSRLNVLKGLGSLFSKRNAVKGLTNVAKLVVAVWIAIAIIRPAFDGVLSLPLLTLPAGFMFMGEIVLRLVLWMLLAFLAIGALDFLYQRWHHREDLKMTKQEVKDERKSTDGDPEVRARRMRIARQIAQQRVRSAVPKSDVVVTNPTHYAVALKYESGKMRAPRVVAKGVDHMALQIRHIATVHGVPILERPALARALYARVEVGQEIPQEQYEAVAEALAYVYRLEGRKAV